MAACSWFTFSDSKALGFSQDCKVKGKEGCGLQDDGVTFNDLERK